MKKERKHKELTREFLLSLKRCCRHGCKNCPYKDENGNYLTQKQIKIMLNQK